MVWLQLWVHSVISQIWSILKLVTFKLNRYSCLRCLTYRLQWTNFSSEVKCFSRHLAKWSSVQKSKRLMQHHFINYVLFVRRASMSCWKLKLGSEFKIYGEVREPQCNRCFGWAPRLRHLWYQWVPRYTMHSCSASTTIINPSFDYWLRWSLRNNIQQS